ncbi:FAD-dependent oxidoreductase [Psychromonas sp. Urea-02u-13]|uniref:FAD-dependent oxidoreductase n=1 Tax=Psychromonas sp. Urea-02u-13 TaxID=2058326 RepID=UPI000C3429CA|nr:FAD-dependent oxidoreductase [Psychromonas sp. Urea-02u-13]PKG37792.1 CoA-disulfide reductase [Psychromonas sp. Urea-02u-13]
MSKKILIVGGVAGGASAAARARRLDENAQIIVFERGPYISFANCGLPYHIGGEIELREKLLLQTPESFNNRFNVDIRVNNEILAINKEAKTVTVRDLMTEAEYTESYDALILSPGASPFIPPISGVSNHLTHSLRNVPDMDAIIVSIETNKPKHATVCGGGFIGLEMVEALRHRGIEVTLIELAPQVMAPVDIEIANVLHQELELNQVELKLGKALQSVAAITEDVKSLLLTLSDDSTQQTNLLIMAVGVKPETSLAVQAGLTIGELGGIQVNAFMQTSDSAIFAVGDAIESPEFTTGDAMLAPLAGPANRQGRLAANVILGHNAEGNEGYKKTQGTAICKVFDLAVASTGLNEKTLQRKNMAYEKVYVHAMSHAGYYPGAHPVTLKLLFNPENGKILGAQAVGKDGVDKRIDVLSVAQRAGLTVYDLQDLELCYAPPFGSARDVVNQAGLLASNVMKGDEVVCHSDDVKSLTENQLLIDVRSAQEVSNMGMIPGAINIAVDDLRANLNQIDKQKEIIVYCQVGLRGHVASCLLTNLGYKVKNLTGGFKTWKAFNY